MVRKLVWDTACRIRQGSRVKVRYDSRRSESEQVMEGKVTEVIARVGECEIHFRRDDGQDCIIKDNGHLISVGSNFPVTGEIKDIKLKGNTG